MVLTRSAAKTIETGKAPGHGNNAVLPEGTTVEHLPPNGTSATKRRRQDVAPPKKRRRGKPGELCQLNLDVLFLVREISSLFCSDYLLTSGMFLDCCIHSSSRPPQPCTHVQITSSPSHGQIFGLCLEECSPPGQWPA